MAGKVDLAREEVVAMISQRITNIDRELTRNQSPAYRDEMARAKARGKREAYEDVLILLGEET